MVTLVKRAAGSVFRMVSVCGDALHNAWWAAGTLVFRNQKKRWAKVAHSGPPPWDARNRIIAQQVRPGASVVDLGCGAQTLRTLIPASCRYQPCDLVQGTPDTILCDFNAGQYPQLPGRFDVTICSGVMEYIREPDTFLRRIAAYGDVLIFTYNARREGESVFSRRAKHWVNDFTRAEVESLFDKCLLDFRILHQDESMGLIYQLRQRQQT